MPVTIEIPTNRTNGEGRFHPVGSQQMISRAAKGAIVKKEAGKVPPFHHFINIVDQVHSVFNVYSHC